MRKLISIVIPAFNEEGNIERAHQALVELAATEKDQYDFEFIFTDNCSQDLTFERLTQIAKSDPRVKVLRFSRNFGYQKSILTGYLNSSGQAVVQFDCDLQDPPELIRQFMRLWEQGYQVVYGVRRTRQEGRVITGLRQIFYRFLNQVSEHPLPKDAGDFRLVDSKVIKALAKIDDRSPYLRGMISEIGFRQVGVDYDRRQRTQGKSKFNFFHLVSLAADGIINHSLIPLRLATYFGLMLFLVNGMGILGYVFAKIFLGRQWPAGFATLFSLVLFGIAVNSLFLGIIGEYLARIYKQVRRGPLTIIDKQLNFSDAIEQSNE